MFEQFSEVIRKLPGRGVIDREVALDGRLRIGRAGEIETHYAPFDHVSKGAKLVLLGITPGWTQMEIALRTARACIDRGMSTEDTLRESKSAASFSGSIRRNLERTLDELGLAEWLGVTDSSQLFEPPANAMVHLTSAVRYPTFKDGENYRGAPRIDRVEILNDAVEHYLVPELASLDQPLVIALGKPPFSVLERIRDRDELRHCRFLPEAVVHPSGAANGYRAAFLRDRAPGLRQRILASTGRS